MMYIDQNGVWKSILFVIPVFSDREKKQFLEFQNILLELNPKMRTTALTWNPDKVETKKKTYQRPLNEWNPSDFNWLGKMKNDDVQGILSSDYDAILLLSDELEDRCIKYFPKNASSLIVGFDSKFEILDVTLKTNSPGLKAKLDLIQAYFLNRG